MWHFGNIKQNGPKFYFGTVENWQSIHVYIYRNRFRFIDAPKYGSQTLLQTVVPILAFFTNIRKDNFFGCLQKSSWIFRQYFCDVRDGHYSQKIFQCHVSYLMLCRPFSQTGTEFVVFLHHCGFFYAEYYFVIAIIHVDGTTATEGIITYITRKQNINSEYIYSKYENEQNIYTHPVLHHHLWYSWAHERCRQCCYW